MAGGLRLFPTTARTCPCVADATAVTSARALPRGNPPRVRRAVQVHHRAGDARFWHWSDIPGDKLRFVEEGEFE